MNVCAQPLEDMYVCRGGDFKSNTIQKNRDSAINKLLLSFRNSSYHGFYHSQVGGEKSEEQVSASLLCPPNIDVDLCKCCVKSVIPFLLKKCPKQNEGVAWDAFPYLHCMVRYSTGRKIIAVLDDWAWYRIPDMNNVKTGELQKTLDSLTSKLNEQAAGGDSYRKYATGQVNYDRDELVLYVSAQCSPDLSKENCNKCLTKASTEMRIVAPENRYFQEELCLLTVF